MQTHKAVWTVVQALIVQNLADVDDASLEQRLWKAMTDRGLAEHGSAELLKTFATSLLKFFVANRAEYTPEAPTTLRLTLGNEEITIRPDDVLISLDGRKTLRRIRTGRMRSAEKDVGTAAFILAAQQAFPDATVEFLYLSDQMVQPITLSTKELGNRRNKLVNFLKSIWLGHFPTEPSARTCPDCPAFFVCGPTPTGALQRNFRPDLPV